MIRYMFDTDTCIYIISQDSKMTLKALPHECALSAIVVGELERGRLVTKRKDFRVGFRSLSTVWPSSPDGEAARAYAKIRVPLEPRGKAIGPNDLGSPRMPDCKT